MTPERQKVVEEVFLGCIEVGPSGWGSVIERRCGSDIELRAEVEGLLACHAGDVGLLDRATPVGGSLLAGLEREAANQGEVPLPPSGKIGHYKVVRVLGSGGMGVVYVGEQERPRRTVALKVLKPGYRSAQVLRRMEHEAELLGRLQHPGIARIYEAGTADAWGLGQGLQPFFAMELVDGPPITDFCRARGLGVRERLALMILVCDAVQHAHQRGVVHRDLKPGNIMVGSDGQPKVLDFGVARATNNDLYVTTMRTSAGQMIGTLPYMSPEQVSADPDQVDTRTDVYALGVVLYELLAGRLPHDVRNRPIPEAARVIRDESPAMLGSVRRELRGDIETIVAKALEKDKARRYQSAAGLADDLRRHLDGEPIAAKRDSAFYVLGKTLARNKGVSGLLAVVLALLVGFAVFASVQAGVQRDKAESEALARARADSALLLAKTESERSERLNSELAARLNAGVIERGRMAAVAGNGAAAEAFLWPALLANPQDRGAWWALRELYAQAPCDWNVQVGGPIAGVVSDGATVFAVDRGGLIKAIDGTSGSTLATGVLQASMGSPGAQAVYASMIGDGLIVIGMSDGWCRVVARRDRSFDEVFSWPAHRGQVERCEMSPAGDVLGTVGADGSLRLWSLPGLTLEREIDAHDAVSPSGVPGSGGATVLSFAPDGRLIATGSRTGECRVWTRSGEPVTSFKAALGVVSSIAFSDDGKRVYTSTGGRSVAGWNALTGEIVVGLGKVDGDASAIMPVPAALAVPGQERLAVAGGLGCRVVTRLPVFESRIIGHSPLGFTRAAWCGSHFIVGGPDGRVRALDARIEPSQRELTGMRSWSFGLDFSPDGRSLAVAAGDGELRLYDPATGDMAWSRSLDGMPIDPLINRQRARYVRFVNDDLILAGCLDGRVRMYERSSGAIKDQVVVGRGEVYGMALSPDFKRLATVCTDRYVRVWEVGTFKKVWEAGPLPLFARGVCFGRDGKMVYSGGSANGVFEWDAQTGEKVRELTTSATPWAVEASPDGHWLGVGTLEAGVDLIDLKTGERRGGTSGHLRVVAALDFSPDSSLLFSGGDDGTVKVWEVASARLLSSLESNAGEVPGLVVSPDGLKLAFSCALRRVIVRELDYHDLHIALATSTALTRYVTPTTPPENVEMMRNWASATLRSAGRVHDGPEEPAGGTKPP